MPTYSYGSPPTNAYNFNDISTILSLLPDNTSKLISPLDVRTAVFTLWENVIFKRTIADGVEYLGLDDTYGGTYSNGLQYYKTYLGKRQFSGADVMTSTLLNGIADVFIYNNKSDSDVNRDKTRLQILAGSVSSLFDEAPYIESEYVVAATTSYIDMNIINDSSTNSVDGSSEGGSINVKSSFGYVTINGISFPKYIDPNGTFSAAYDGYYLKYNQYGLLTLDPVNSITGITQSGTVSITGSPVLINNQETNFLTDATPVPVDIGGILAGTTFSSVSVVEVLRQLLYPYLVPLVSFTLKVRPSSGTYTTSGTTNVVVEYDTTGTYDSIYASYGFSYSYTITKRTYNVSSVTSNYIVNLPSTPISATETGTLNIAYASLDLSTLGTRTFTLSVGDGTQSYTASAVLNKVLPYFYGSHATSSLATAISSLTKKVKAKSDTTVGLSGSAIYAHFAYPYSYGLLTTITDNNGFDVTSAFTYSIVSLSSPDGYWSSQNYYSYRTINSTHIGVPPTYTTPVNYVFSY